MDQKITHTIKHVPKTRYSLDNQKALPMSKFVPAFISPLHDKDMNPTNEPKKPHYHVIITFDSVKTTEQSGF